MSSLIDTESLSQKYRDRSIDIGEKKVRITRFGGTKQDEDLTERPNCSGLGRIRHFRRETSANWPKNPLPIDPACFASGTPPSELIRAQVFQTAACNWRCWYCFVDFKLLSANPDHSEWVSADRLVELYGAQANPPPMI